jgi:hypothetical protein
LTIFPSSWDIKNKNCGFWLLIPYIYRNERKRGEKRYGKQVKGIGGKIKKGGTHSVTGDEI